MPVFFIEAPSQNVSSYERISGLCYCNELYIDGEPYGSNPISFVYGLIWLKYEAIPEHNPPPPQHEKT